MMDRNKQQQLEAFGIEIGSTVSRIATLSADPEVCVRRRSMYARVHVRIATSMR
jgi:hypothetical protein